MLSGSNSVISLGRFMIKPRPPIKNMTCSESWILPHTKIIEPKISKIISSKLLYPTRSLIKNIEPIEIVDDESKYPNQLGART